MKLTNEQSLVPKFYRLELMYTGVKVINFNNCSLTNFEIDKNKFDIKRTLYGFIKIYDGIIKEISHEKILNHIKENFPYNNGVKDICPKSTCKYHTELQNFKNKFSNTNELNIILDKYKFKKTSCEKASNGEGDVPCLRTKGNSFLYLIFGNDADNIINILLKVTIISAPIFSLFLILFK
ncbi:hypothetical protein PVMG_06224, partial [Plasmodium vivax Mauritania I]